MQPSPSTSMARGLTLQPFKSHISVLNLLLQTYGSTLLTLATGYCFHTNLTGEGRGGASLIRKKEWSHKEAIPVGARILVVRLINSEGQEICVTSAHFHHKASQTVEQRKALSAVLASLPCPHKIPPADRHSLIVPARYSSPVFEDKTHSILEAREIETKALQQLNLHDVYAHVHRQQQDRGLDPLDGYTFGYGVRDPCEGSSNFETEMRHIFRCTDRIHMSPTLLPHLSECCTAFIARADHKAVLASCMPPAFDTTSCRFKRPKEILQDDDTLDRLGELLQELPGGPEQWWDRASHALRYEAI